MKRTDLPGLRPLPQLASVNDEPRPSDAAKAELTLAADNTRWPIRWPVTTYGSAEMAVTYAFHGADFSKFASAFVDAVRNLHIQWVYDECPPETEEPA